MPVIVHAETRRLSQEEFTAVVYDTMRHVFAVHNELGRLFDEPIYQREIARRCGGLTEVPVEVTHAGCRKFYFLDLLVASGVIVELKSVERLSASHRAQLLNYLLLSDLPRGKLVNVRGESVEHEFINTTLRPADRMNFAIDDRQWDSLAPGGAALRNVTESMLRDLGTGLELAMYQEFVIQLLGGNEAVERDVEVMQHGQTLGIQKLPLAGTGAAFRFSAIRDEDCARFAEHLSRFLSHTNLNCLHWINVTRSRVCFTTLHSPDA